MIFRIASRRLTRRFSGQILRLRIEQLAERPDLLPVVAAWIYDEWWTRTPGASPDTVVGLLREHCTPDEIPLTLIASSGGHPIGTASLLPRDVGTKRWPALSPWLAAVYVVPEHQRRGIGGALVDAAAAKATTAGVEELYLLTSGREGFYAALGWEVVERRADEVVMSKHTAV